MGPQAGGQVGWARLSWAVVPERPAAALQHQHHVDVGTLGREPASLSFSLTCVGRCSSRCLLGAWGGQGPGGGGPPDLVCLVPRAGALWDGVLGKLPRSGPSRGWGRSLGPGRVPGCPGLRRTQLQSTCQEPTLGGSQRFWGDRLGGASSPGPPQGRGGSRGRTGKEARGATTAPAALLDPPPRPVNSGKWPPFCP